MLYIVFMVASLPKTLAKNLIKNLTRNLIKNLAKNLIKKQTPEQSSDNGLTVNRGLRELKGFRGVVPGNVV